MSIFQSVDLCEVVVLGVVIGQEIRLQILSICSHLKDIAEAYHFVFFAVFLSDNSFGNSFKFTQNNILGTHVLLESAKVVTSLFTCIM